MGFVWRRRAGGGGRRLAVVVVVMIAAGCGRWSTKHCTRAVATLRGETGLPGTQNQSIFCALFHTSSVPPHTRPSSLLRGKSLGAALCPAVVAVAKHKLWTSSMDAPSQDVAWRVDPGARRNPSPVVEVKTVGSPAPGTCLLLFPVDCRPARLSRLHDTCA